ncbi:MAG TPA: glycosyltransferase family 2 protein [Longimicrobiales bacterium]
MIYICIPAYNEARTIGVVLWKIRQVMAEFRRDYQILVLDDASTDDTHQVVTPYTRVLPLTVIRHEERRGYAASLEELFQEAVRRSNYPRRDLIVTIQADFTEDPDQIPALVKRIEAGADVVIGALKLEPRKSPRSVRWGRKLLLYLLRRMDWPEGISDPLSGFRAYRLITIRRALEAQNGQPLLTRQGWAANVEILRAVVPHARRLDETTVPVRYDRRSRGTRFRLWETFKEILSLTRAKQLPPPSATPPQESARSQEPKPRPRPHRRRSRPPAQASAAATATQSQAAQQNQAASPQGEKTPAAGSPAPAQQPASRSRNHRRPAPRRSSRPRGPAKSGGELENEAVGQP